MLQFVTLLILMVTCHVQSHMSAGPGVGGQFLGPQPGSAPRARGPALKRHQNIHVNMAEEREHLKSHIKEQYINAESLDDNSLLMQYFRKHDTDDNMKLDGLELMKALARMEEADHQHDADGGHPDADTVADPFLPVFDILEIIPIVDTILAEDDKNKDGYISWAEFVSKQENRGH
eukprot:GFUD01061851.1.p1 GENE.GFUD01061851.1~~GFUD01061851.1.p1  ORF type:complete len:176 (-),score=55.28 GFUD01061851.1:299-826(-)